MRGATRRWNARVMVIMAFQSTLPMRGATPLFTVGHLIRPFQSTLPMRGATYRRQEPSCHSSHFNPHSPCGERLCGKLAEVTRIPFQSTLPMRGATRDALRLWYDMFISIHTPHAGSDQQRVPPSAPAFYFNPHSPCGERRKSQQTTSKP